MLYAFGMATETGDLTLGQTIIQRDWLQEGLIARHWTVEDLLHHSGISSNTAAKINKGLPVTLSVRYKIEEAFRQHAPLEASA